MKNPMTLAGIEPAAFRFVAQHLKDCATAVSMTVLQTGRKEAPDRTLWTTGFGRRYGPVVRQNMDGMMIILCFVSPAMHLQDDTSVSLRLGRTRSNFVKWWKLPTII